MLNDHVHKGLNLDLKPVHGTTDDFSAETPHFLLTLKELL
jgi:hypothetical protein